MVGHMVSGTEFKELGCPPFILINKEAEEKSTTLLKSLRELRTQGKSLSPH